MINKKKGNIAIAIAIVIAGLIVAGAVMFTNKDKVATPTNSDPVIEINEVNDSDWIRGGDLNAPVKIVEFSDTECPYCSILHPTLKQVIEDYNGQVAWVYRHFPIPQLHPIAPTVSHALECVGELGGQDAFWSLTDKIYQMSYDNVTSEDPKNLSAHAENPALLEDYAAELVDREQYKVCMDETRYQEEVTKDYQDAITAGGNGTPFNVLVLEDELGDEQIALIKTTAQKVNRAGQPPVITISGDGKAVSLAGALPMELWKEVLDAILN